MFLHFFCIHRASQQTLHQCLSVLKSTFPCITWTWPPLIPALPSHHSLKPLSQADWLLVSLASSHLMLCRIIAPSCRHRVLLHNALMGKINFNNKERGINYHPGAAKGFRKKPYHFSKLLKGPGSFPTGDTCGVGFYLFFQVHMEPQSAPSILSKMYLLPHEHYL